MLPNSVIGCHIGFIATFQTFSYPSITKQILFIFNSWVFSSQSLAVTVAYFALSNLITRMPNINATICLRSCEYLAKWCANFDPYGKGALTDPTARTEVAPNLPFSSPSPRQNCTWGEFQLQLLDEKDWNLKKQLKWGWREGERERVDEWTENII